MAQTYPLDRVIRLVASGHVPAADERVVVIDAQTQQIAGRRPFLGWGTAHRHYLVCNALDPDHIAHLEFRALQLRDLDTSVNVAVTIQATCPADSESIVALALSDPALSPLDVLERRLRRWLIDMRGASVAEFARRYFKDRGKLAKEMCERAHRETGLQADIKLTLEAENSFGAIRVQVPHLPLRVKDYDEEQDLSLTVDLEVDSANKANAVLHFPNNRILHTIVPQAVQRFYRQRVTLQVFNADPHGAKLRAELTAHLNAELEQAGRIVAAITLEPTLVDDLPSFVEVDVDVTCQVQEYPTSIVVTNRVQMVLKDAALFKTAGPADIYVWIEATLGRIIRQRLFEARYIDLLIRFDPLKAAIKKALVGEATALGYDIKQLIIGPDLAPLRLREPFMIDPEATFETKVAGVYVKLHIVVTARIPNLEKIEWRLNRQQDVRLLMQDVICNVARQYLHKVEPERFYMRFSFVDPTHPEETQSVEGELSALIKAAIEGDQFHAEAIDIVIKMVDTDLIERFKKLQERICGLDVLVDPLQGGPSVQFCGNLRITAVDSAGWQRFQISTCTLDELQAQVKSRILAWLQTLPSKALEYTSEAHREELQDRIQTLTEDYIRKEFGLVAEISNIRRAQTSLEAEAFKHALSRNSARLQINSAYIADTVEAEISLNKSKIDQISQLVSRRLELVERDGTDAEITDIDRKINALKDTLGREHIPSIEELENTIAKRELPPADVRRLLSPPSRSPGERDDGGGADA